MTVIYSPTITTASLKATIKILLKWSGSVYQLIWKEFLFFFGTFYLFHVVYNILPIDMKGYFLFGVEYCQRFEGTIPVTLFLGFYVSFVIKRFFYQFDALPWLCSLPVENSNIVIGFDEKSRLYRRTIMRYLNLSYVMTLSTISPPCKKRFPTLNHLQHAGLLIGNEKLLIESLNTLYLKYFAPIVWINNLIFKARKENYIDNDFQQCYHIQKIIDFRDDLMMMNLYDFVQMPIIYTQAVTICVYTYFLSCLLSRQHIDGRSLTNEISFPFFTFLQFFFYVGWLKVAEETLNPFGDDADDYEPNELIDFNFTCSFLVVDEMFKNLPPLVQDELFPMGHNFSIPYHPSQLEKKISFAKPLDVKIPVDHLNLFVPRESKLCLLNKKKKYNKKIPKIYVTREERASDLEIEQDYELLTN